jgi:hypothetical protein
MKHLKMHLQHICIANATYATFRWNICNTRWNICNIRWNIHLKRMKTYRARCHGVMKKLGPALSCQRSTATEVANGACRCGLVLLSQTGKRPGRPCNLLIWLAIAVSMQQGQLALDVDNTERERKCRMPGRQATGLGGRVWLGRPVGPTSSGLHSKESLSVVTHMDGSPHATGAGPPDSNRHAPSFLSWAPHARDRSVRSSRRPQKSITVHKLIQKWWGEDGCEIYRRGGKIMHLFFFFRGLIVQISLKFSVSLFVFSKKNRESIIFIICWNILK